MTGQGGSAGREGSVEPDSCFLQMQKPGPKGGRGLVGGQERAEAGLESRSPVTQGEGVQPLFYYGNNSLAIQILILSE